MSMHDFREVIFGGNDEIISFLRSKGLKHDLCKVSKTLVNCTE